MGRGGAGFEVRASAPTLRRGFDEIRRIETNFF